MTVLTVIQQTKYTWVPTGAKALCACGGKLIQYRIHPKRSSAYLNHVMVCDNPICATSVVHRGKDNERRGRAIL